MVAGITQFAAFFKALRCFGGKRPTYPEVWAVFEMSTPWVNLVQEREDNSSGSWSCENPLGLKAPLLPAPCFFHSGLWLPPGATLQAATASCFLLQVCSLLLLHAPSY